MPSPGRVRRTSRARTGSQPPRGSRRGGGRDSRIGSSTGSSGGLQGPRSGRDGKSSGAQASRQARATSDGASVASAFASNELQPPPRPQTSRPRCAVAQPAQHPGRRATSVPADVLHAARTARSPGPAAPPGDRHAACPGPMVPPSTGCWRTSTRRAARRRASMGRVWRATGIGLSEEQVGYGGRRFVPVAQRQRQSAQNRPSVGSNPTRDTSFIGAKRDSLACGRGATRRRVVIAEDEALIRLDLAEMLDRGRLRRRRPGGGRRAGGGTHVGAPARPRRHGRQDAAARRHRRRRADRPRPHRAGRDAHRVQPARAGRAGPGVRRDGLSRQAVHASPTWSRRSRWR